MARDQDNDTDILRNKDMPRGENLRDEMSPKEGEPVRQDQTGGDRPDTAGQHGEMKPEAARGLEQTDESETRE